MVSKNFTKSCFDRVFVISDVDQNLTPVIFVSEEHSFCTGEIRNVKNLKLLLDHPQLKYFQSIVVLIYSVLIHMFMAI